MSSVADTISIERLNKTLVEARQDAHDLNKRFLRLLKRQRHVVVISNGERFVVTRLTGTGVEVAKNTVETNSKLRISTKGQKDNPTICIEYEEKVRLQPNLNVFKRRDKSIFDIAPVNKEGEISVHFFSRSECTPCNNPRDFTEGNIDKWMSTGFQPVENANIARDMLESMDSVKKFMKVVDDVQQHARHGAQVYRPVK